jgi:hypothetical protein
VPVPRSIGAVEDRQGRRNRSRVTPLDHSKSYESTSSKISHSTHSCVKSDLCVDWIVDKEGVVGDRESRARKGCLDRKGFVCGIEWREGEIEESRDKVWCRPNVNGVLALSKSERRK